MDEMRELTLRMAQQQIKIYSWSDFGPYEKETQLQLQFIVAAKSKLAAARAFGKTRADQLWNLGDSANEESMRIAMADIGKVFCRPLDRKYDQGYKPYKPRF